MISGGVSAILFFNTIQINWRVGKRLGVSGKERAMSIYDKHLRWLGANIIIVRILRFVLIFGFERVFHRAYPSKNLQIELAALGVALAMAGIAFLCTRRKDLLRFTIPVSFVLLVLMVILSQSGAIDPDSLFDFSFLMMNLVVFIEWQIRKRQRILLSIHKLSPQTLDLRVVGQTELFNPRVMGPKLKPNQSIIDDIDSFLESSVAFAPLCICFHSAQNISPALQETMIEVLRLHYKDEQKRVEKYLEKRYIRIVGLLLVSMGMLRLLSLFFSGQDSDRIVWVMFSNFAAFSLWQIGTTHFEREEAFENLTRFIIARESRVEFNISR